MKPEIAKVAKSVRLLLMDCDGVLTDGKIYLGNKGEVFKAFHVRDGQGLVLWHSAGFFSGIISGRKSKILQARADELGISIVKQGVKNKVSVLEGILNRLNLSAEETAFIGDDINDICLMLRVGLPITVADAVAEVKNVAKLVTKNKGGCGAVREVIEILLKAKEIRLLELSKNQSIRLSKKLENL
jgi:3-deoxy-D-manno-octulosonate 8-phosphate phosphatase (KDO 8-P phosphatase)